jgi:beta-lactamase class A
VIQHGVTQPKEPHVMLKPTLVALSLALALSLAPLAAMATGDATAAGVPAAAATGATPAAGAPKATGEADRSAALQAALQSLADKARPAQFGIIVINLDDGTTARVGDDRAYMLMSVFKAPVAAAVLHGVDAGTLHLDQTVHLTPADVVAGSAVPSIGTRAAKGAIDVTVAELLSASVSQSDNTSVDALLKLLGGGPRVTAYLDGKGVHGMRIDVGEREVGQVFDGLADGARAPAQETAQAKDARRRRGYEAAIAMPQNTTTLEGAATFLRKLQTGELLSPVSTRYLLELMQAQVVPTRIRAGLPAGFTIADKTGTGSSYGKRIAAWNDMAIVTAPNGKRAVVAAFLRDTASTDEQRTAWFRELGALVAGELR